MFENSLKISKKKKKNFVNFKVIQLEYKKNKKIIREIYEVIGAIGILNSKKCRFNIIVVFFKAIVHFILLIRSIVKTIVFFFY